MDYIVTQSDLIFMEKYILERVPQERCLTN